MAGKDQEKKGGIDPSLKGFIKETSRDTGYRKAARFLVLLGKDEAAKVLTHLSAEEVEGIAREIARTEKIDHTEASKILEEFGYIRQTRDIIVSGGIQKAEEMLIASLGKEKAAAILEKVKKQMAPPPFSFLMDIDIHQAVALLRDETPPVLALILSHLEPKVAARILSALPRETQKEVVPRIAKMNAVDPEVIRRAEETLRGKVRESGTVISEEVDGKAALTEILRYMDPTKEEIILQDLEPNTANEIRKSLFTVDVILRISPKDLQSSLREYADREIALMMRVLDEEVKDRILENVSERRREFITMEMENRGPVKKRDAEAALDEFLSYLQLLEQKGEITILRDTDTYV
jgi:flagellar motor switch protein FliG